MLAPLEWYYRRRDRPQEEFTDWTRQVILQMRRWLPNCPPVLVVDSGYPIPVLRHGASLNLLHICQSLREPVTRRHPVAQPGFGEDVG